MSKVTIMVIDDEVDFNYMMSYWLKAKGYNVISKSNGVDALETIKKNPPDMVFLDISMPLMDGIEVLRKIREVNKDLPVIMITAYGTKERLEICQKLGISGFFAKEDDFDSLLHIIDTILKLHKGLKK
jgi:two-component system response regulator (stage 0 sporulation protein F)